MSRPSNQTQKNKRSFVGVYHQSRESQSFRMTGFCECLSHAITPYFRNNSSRCTTERPTGYKKIIISLRRVAGAADGEKRSFIHHVYTTYQKHNASHAAKLEQLSNSSQRVDTQIELRFKSCTCTPTYNIHVLLFWCKTRSLGREFSVYPRKKSRRHTVTLVLLQQPSISRVSLLAQASIQW